MFGYEHGFKHQNDITQLNPSSHMLKHLIDCHKEENWQKNGFLMEIIDFFRRANECQIMESVQIQHYRLNSKSEFNMSVIPCLWLKMGDKQYNETKKEETVETEKKVKYNEAN